MSIELKITADNYVDLARGIANLYSLIPIPAKAETATMPVDGAEVIPPARKKPGRPPPKVQVVEIEPVAEQSAPAVEVEPVAEANPQPEITAKEIQDRVIAFVNDKAQTITPEKGVDPRRTVFTAFQKEFGIGRMPDLKPEQYPAVLAYLEANAPAAPAAKDALDDIMT